MPRRRGHPNETEHVDETVDVEFTIRKNGQVHEFLKNNYYDLLVKTGQPLECPICFESVIGCRNCFCLLICGHAMHLHEYLKVTRCPGV